MRRGSSTMIFLFFSHGASNSARGTRVVLPAPGGATSTPVLLPASVCASSSSTASIGRGLSKLRGKLGSFRLESSVEKTQRVNRGIPRLHRPLVHPCGRFYRHEE